MGRKIRLECPSYAMPSTTVPRHAPILARVGLQLPAGLGNTASKGRRCESPNSETGVVDVSGKIRSSHRNPMSRVSDFMSGVRELDGGRARLRSAETGRE